MADIEEVGDGTPVTMVTNAPQQQYTQYPGIVEKTCMAPVAASSDITDDGEPIVESDMQGGDGQTNTCVGGVDGQTNTCVGGVIEGGQEEEEVIQREQFDSGALKDPSDKGNTPQTADPYFYLKREEFTSEIFKIEINNLPVKFGFAQLKKMLNGLKLKPNKIKAIPCKTFAYVTFRCEEDREQAMSVLEGHTWRGSSLTVKKASPTADPFQMKRKVKDSGGGRSEKRRKVEEEEDIPWNIKLKNAVTPLWNMDYEKQLQVKTGLIEEVLKKLTRQLEKECPTLKAWLKEQRGKHNGKCCELLPIKESPVLTGYRNKCEFTVGTSPEGQEKTVGFRLGKYRGGLSSVGEPYDCAFLSENMKRVIKVFQDYIRQSKYEGFSPETHDGNWRQMTVREVRSGEVMAFPEFHPQDLSEEEIRAEVGRIRDYFMSGPGQSSGITTMFVDISSERISGAAPSNASRHVFGEKVITEDLLGMKFRISPDAFFQVNTAAAEVLYSTIADWCDPKPTTTVLDICCGTGTIGISIAKRVAKVVGVEMCQQAVDDAQVNAKINEVANAEFHCSKAEDVLSGLMMRLRRDQEAVAIVDPPRAGLHSKVIQALRRCPRLKKLIYVSCSPKSVLQNFLDLCRPVSRRLKGPPYKLVKAVPVDLFPHTNLCELILLFERDVTE